MDTRNTRSRGAKLLLGDDEGSVGDESQQVSAIFDAEGDLRAPPVGGAELGTYLIDFFNYQEKCRKRLEDKVNELCMELVASKALVQEQEAKVERLNSE